MSEISLVILAAGLGSRYGGLKQIDPVGPNGELLIEYSIHDALSAGFDHIVFVIQKNQEGAFRDLLGSKLVDRCRVSFAHQEMADVPSDIAVPANRLKPWGTGHAVLSSRHVVPGPFAVINADDFYGRESYANLMRFILEYDTSSRSYAMVGFDLRKTITTHGTVSRGVCRAGANGMLQGIDERTKVGLQKGNVAYWDDQAVAHTLPATSIASMNMWAFPQAFMHGLAELFEVFLRSEDTDLTRDEFFLPDAVSALTATQNASVRVLSTPASWMGVTYREDLSRVREGIRNMIDDGLYPSLLWEGKG